MNRAELIANMQATAARLAGRPVKIRIRDYANGGVTKSLTGECVMDLSPAIFDDAELMLYLLTHEAAHARKHFDALPHADIDRDMSPEVKAAKLYAVTNINPAYKAREDEAEALAREWRDTVRENYRWRYSACGDRYLAILKSLYHDVEER